MNISPQNIKLGLAILGTSVLMLTAHVSLKEATTTSTGIENTIDTNSLKNLKMVADSVFEPSRRHFGVPIHISSAFRNTEVNQAVGGVRNSEHLKGQAMDLILRKNGVNKNRELFQFIRDSLKFNQLIWEMGGAWVHVSYKKNKNKQQIIY